MGGRTIGKHNTNEEGSQDQVVSGGNAFTAIWFVTAGGIWGYGNGYSIPLVHDSTKLVICQRYLSRLTGSPGSQGELYGHTLPNTLDTADGCFLRSSVEMDDMWGAPCLRALPCGLQDCV